MMIFQNKSQHWDITSLNHNKNKQKTTTTKRERKENVT